jgi:hypothetical protein
MTNQRKDPELCKDFTFRNLDVQKSDKPDTEEKAKEKFQQRRNYVM